MVLPILILTVFSLMMAMVWAYQVHQSQIVLHKELMKQAAESDAVFRVQKETQKNESWLDGMAVLFLTSQRQHRIYEMKPAQVVLIGEMAGLSDDG